VRTDIGSIAQTDLAYTGLSNKNYTIYIGGVYEVNKDSGGTVLGSTSYYPVAGAMRVNGTLYYTLRDQLSSASEVLDASGAIVGEQRYYPFGETRVATGSMFTDRLYTGQRAMVGIGLDFYNARYYDPSLGRFISPDTITPGGPQGLNRYSYVMNSPIDFSDPSGHNTCAAFVNGTCVHEVSDADQKLINENGSTTKSPSSSVVTTTPNTPGNGNGGKGNNGSSTCNWICQKESFIETVYNDSYPEVIDAIKKYGPLILEAPGILGVFIGDPQGAEDFEVDAENLIAEGDPVDGLQALIDDANQQYPKLAEKADQLHHIFPKYLGGDPDGPLVSLPPAYHQVITNAFRAAWAYGQEVPPLEEALKILQQIYGKFPLP
jgi:RHS repeat-associated protein